MDIGRELTQLRKRLEAVERQARLSSASIDGTSIAVRDDTGSLRALVGQQADGTTAANFVNGPPPPVPSAPVVASARGGVSAAWDGTFAEGAVVPLDWSRVEVHASPDTGFTPTSVTLMSTIETPQGAIVIIPTDDPVYVRLMARNTSGTASTPSTQTGPYGPADVVATDILDGIVTTTKLAAEAVTAAKVKLGAIGTDQLALGVGNLAPDPSFEGERTEQLIDGLTDWSVVTPGNNSPKALHVDCTAGALTWKNVEIGRYPVLPGEWHYLALDYKVSADFDGTGAKLMFRYEDATSTVTGWGVAEGPLVPGGAWDSASAQVLAPADTVTAVLLLEASEVTVGEAWFDNIQVRTMVAGGMVVAGTITANELTTGAVTTAKLDALAVTAEKLAALAVTAEKIAALAITTDKLDANAVTTAKLAAGSVDATALKADAITGKTITGGVINGAEFHSDDGAGGLVDIEDGTIIATSSDGWKILIDPTQTFPVIGWLLPGGATAAAVNGNVDDTIPGLNLSSGPFTDGAITDWRWITYMGKNTDGTNSWKTRRIRQSDPNRFLGGQILAGPTYASLSYIDSLNPSTNTFFEVFTGLAQLVGGRFAIAPPASALASVYVDAAAGHTGMLIRADVDDVPMFQVTPTGGVVATGGVTAASASISGTATTNELAVTTTTWTSYTPTVAGHGTGTFTSRTGYYYKLGKLVYFTAEVVMNAAGTGTSTVTITAPSSVHRTTRQVFPCHGQSTTTSGAVMNGHAVALETGSGAVIDRISLSNDGSTNRDNILQGANLLAGCRVTISGWYREA